MINKEERKERFSWFWKWILNNQVVTALLIILLGLVIVLVFSKVSYMFDPIWQFFGIVGFPVVLAGILYYMLNPVVNWLEKHRVPRIIGIVLVFIGIIALITWGLVIVVPKVQSQTVSFIKNWPSYWDQINNTTIDLLKDPFFNQFKNEIDSIGTELFSSAGSILKELSKNTVQSIGSVVGVVANVVVAVITMPFVLFYLLRDGDKLPGYVIQFVPTKLRNHTMTILTDVNNQLSSYIRGQLTVALSVAVMFIIGFSFIGLEYGIMLGVMAGFLNLIPYLGSFLAMIPAVILALVAGPVMLVKVLIVFVIEHTIEGRVISPLVLGSQLSIHPITIIFVLLTSGKLFGIVGVILGIPGYAAIKVIVTHLFKWHQESSGLYKEDPKEVINQKNK